MAQILQFPKRNRNRKRKSTGARAEGIFAMMQFDIYPANVAHIHQSRFDGVTLAELLAFSFDTMFRSLPVETRAAVKRSALCEAAISKDRRKMLVAAVVSNAFAPREA